MSSSLQVLRTQNRECDKVERRVSGRIYRVAEHPMPRVQRFYAVASAATAKGRFVVWSFVRNAALTGQSPFATFGSITTFDTDEKFATRRALCYARDARCRIDWCRKKGRIKWPVNIRVDATTCV